MCSFKLLDDESSWNKKKLQTSFKLKMLLYFP